MIRDYMFSELFISLSHYLNCMKKDYCFYNNRMLLITAMTMNLDLHKYIQKGLFSCVLFCDSAKIKNVIHLSLNNDHVYLLFFSWSKPTLRLKIYLVYISLLRIKNLLLGMYIKPTSSYL